MKFASLAILFLSSVAVQAATITYHVSVDSSGISGSVPGYIELQFNPAVGGNSLPATATIDNFTSTSFTFDDLSNFSLGGVTGSLSSLPLSFDSSVGGANLFDQGVTVFGTTFGFDVTLSGAALDTTAPDGNAFFVYLLGTDFSPLVLQDGLVASIVINGDTSITTNPTDLSTIEANTVPEPASLVLMLAGVSLVGFTVASRRK